MTPRSFPDQRRRAPKAPRRTGATLVELLVALPLSLLVAVMAVAVLLHVARTARGQGARLATARELRHARLILARDLEPLHGSEVLLLSDTLLEIRAHLGVLVLCAASGASEVDVAAPEAAPEGSWMGGVRAGDDLVAWAMPPAPSDTPQRVHGVVAQPPVALGDGPCGPAPMAPLRPRWRLTLGTPPVTPLSPGMPVSIGRPVRYRHYQSGTRWWLGRRTRDAKGWDVTQPVAGPFLSRSDNGVHMRGFTRAGLSTALPESLALLRITMRAPRAVHDAKSPIIDSAALEVALRAAPSHRPLP